MKNGGISWGVLTSLIIVTLIGYSIMSEQEALTSRLFMLTFFLTAILYIWGVIRKIISSSFNTLVLLSIILAFVGVCFSGFGGFDYFKKVIMYSTTLMWLSYGTSIKISRKTILICFIPIFILNNLYLLYFNSGFSLYDGESFLTLNFTNPNLTGMFMMNSVLYMGILAFGAMDLFKGKFLIIISFLAAIIVSISVLSLLLLTGCRSALMSIAAFLILVIWDYIKRGNLSYKKWVFALVAWLPFIFVFFYLADVGSIDVDVSFGYEAGKGAGSRIKIWKPIVDNFFSYIVTGDYYGISKGTGISQMHNTHLDVFASYGFIPLLLYISLLTKTMWKTWRQSSSRFKRCALYAFISCQFSYMFEAGFVAGSAGMYILTVGFIIFANYDNNESIAGKQCLRPA